MGALISSVVSQIVMEDLEETVLDRVSFYIPFFYRYVDDSITAVPKDKVNFILEHFNKYHKKIQFTIEIEEHNSINFSNVTLHHKNEKIKTELYTKKTWSSRYLNYQSNHSIAKKNQ